MTEEKYIATLLGCAIGDALGMPVEGWYREQIKKYVGRITELRAPVIIRDRKGTKVEEDEFGKIGYWTGTYKKGEYTDDTLLTLALARSISKKRGFDLEDVAKKQLEAYELCLNEKGELKNGFGGTTMEACKRLKAGISPLESGVIGGPGNGPAMKMSPVGMYMHAAKDYYNGLEFAKQVSQITHLDPRSIASGIVQAHAICALLFGIDKKDFLESLVDVCERHENALDERFTWHKSGSLSQRLKWIIENKGVDDETAFQYFGKIPDKNKLPKVSSAVYKSYPFSLWMFQKYWDNPFEGLVETVNFGGDCDTTGAIYGALAGAKHGLSIFPEEFVRDIKDVEEIFELGRSIYALNISGGKK